MQLDYLCQLEGEVLTLQGSAVAVGIDADLKTDVEAPVTGMAQYGHSGDRARAIILTERDRPPKDEGSPGDLGNKHRLGLPPFGDAVPIFPGGSPAPSPVSVQSRSSAEEGVAAWVVNWECVSIREA